jgi:hypothetical protein
MSLHPSHSDLNSLVEDFETWQRITSELCNENKELKLQISTLQKQCQLYEQTEKHLRQSYNLTFQVNKLNDLHQVIRSYVVEWNHYR